jgi:hypothetical protein
MKDENKNRLETFVKANRQEFDQADPGDHVWPSIDLKILANAKPWYQQEVWLWRAASLVLLLVSLFLYQHNNNVGQQQLATNNHEFDQVEGFYVSKISEKRNQIEAFQKEDLEVNQAYEVDLQRLDAMYEVLKEELGKNPSKEVKDALTLNLLIRIDLLNNQLQVIEELDSDVEPVEQAV